MSTETGIAESLEKLREEFNALKRDADEQKRDADNKYNDLARELKDLKERQNLEGQPVANSHSLYACLITVTVPFLPPDSAQGRSQIYGWFALAAITGALLASAKLRAPTGAANDRADFTDFGAEAACFLIFSLVNGLAYNRIAQRFCSFLGSGMSIYIIAPVVLLVISGLVVAGASYLKMDEQRLGISLGLFVVEDVILQKLAAWCQGKMASEEANLETKARKQ